MIQKFGMNILKKFFASSTNTDASNGFASEISQKIGYSSSSGLKVNEYTASFNSAVFGCQRGISEAIAMIPRHIYKDLDDNQREKVKEHPTIKILSQEANPLMTSYIFFRTFIYHLLNSGNAYAEIQFERRSGRAVALWPIPPERVSPEVIITESGMLDLIYHINLSSGKRVTLTKDKILHVPGLGYDGIRGYPVIEIMANAIGLSNSLESYGALFFAQGSDIQGYVSIPDDFSEEQIKNMKKHQEIINGGLSNAHRFKFLYESAKFVPTGAKPQESQMLESRTFQVQEIARFFKYPLHKLQEHSKSGGYASLEQLNTEYVNECLMPFIVPIEQELNRKLFTDPRDSGNYIKFNINALMRGDSTARANFYRTMVMSGLMTANEIRALEDLSPSAGGDKRLVPLNMTDAASDKQMDAVQRVQD